MRRMGIAQTAHRCYDSYMALFGRPTVQDQRREAFWRAWIQRQHPLALASLVLSVFSFTHFGTLWVDELAGIILGSIALAQLRRSNGERREGKLIASVGIGVGVLSFACACVIYFVLPRVNAG